MLSFSSLNIIKSSERQKAARLWITSPNLSRKIQKQQPRKKVIRKISLFKLLDKFT
jgi:hypothetical protein